MLESSESYILGTGDDRTFVEHDKVEEIEYTVLKHIMTELPEKARTYEMIEFILSESRALLREQLVVLRE